MLKNVSWIFLVFTYLGNQALLFAITPYKYQENELSEISYVIPASERYTLTRNESDGVSSIVYYFSPPAQLEFPIAIVCGDSSLENDIHSIIHVHRYFLQEFHHLGVGVLTIEQQGVDGDRINVAEFMENYTRSNRLNDHRNVMNFLIGIPFQNWNQHFLLFGISEGGAIVTTLASEFEDRVIATVNWAGAHGFLWQDQLWDYMQKYLKQSSWMTQFRRSLPAWMPFSKKFDFPPIIRNAYDTLMVHIAEHPM